MYSVFSMMAGPKFLSYWMTKESHFGSVDIAGPGVGACGSRLLRHFPWRTSRCRFAVKWLMQRVALIGKGKRWLGGVQLVRTCSRGLY